MEIQRQSEQYALTSPMYHQASIPDEDLREMLSGPRIQAGYLNTREGISKSNPAGDLNKAPYKLNQEALNEVPKPMKPPPLPKLQQPGTQQPIKQNVASRRIVADDGGGYFSTEPGGMFGPAKPGGADWSHYFSGEPGGMFGPAATPSTSSTPAATPATPVADKGPAGGAGAVPSAAGATPTTPGGIQGPRPAGTAGAPATPQGMQPGGDWAHSLNTSPLAAGEHTVAPGETVSDLQSRAGGGAISGISGDMIHPGDKYTVGGGGSSGTTAPTTPSHAPVQGPGLPGNPGGPPAASIGNTNGGKSIDYKTMYQGGGAASAAPTAAPVQGPGLPGNPGGPPKTSSYHVARDRHGNSYFDDSKGYRYFLAQGGDPASDNPDLKNRHDNENQPAGSPPAKATGTSPGTPSKGSGGTPPGVKMTTDSVPPVGGGEKPSAAGGSDSYTVKPGDTLSGIAQSHGLGNSLQGIVDANPGNIGPSGTNIKSNPNMIHPGDVFKMPGAGAGPGGAIMPPAPASENVAPGEAPVPGFVPAGGRGPMDAGGNFVPPHAGGGGNMPAPAGVPAAAPAAGEAPAPGFVPPGGRGPMAGGMFVPPKAAYRLAHDRQGNSYFSDSKGYRYFLADADTDKGSTGAPGRTNDLAQAGNPNSASGGGPVGQPASLGMQKSPGGGAGGALPGGGGGIGDVSGVISGVMGMIPGLSGLSGLVSGIGGMIPHLGARQCQGSNRYPTAQHHVEELYRCAGCGLWGPVTVLNKMIDHRQIEANDSSSMAGEVNSGGMPPVAPMAPIAPLGTGAVPGVVSGTDALTQAAGSPMLPTLK